MVQSRTTAARTASCCIVVGTAVGAANSDMRRDIVRRGGPP
jgi:hypothetical protein